MEAIKKLDGEFSFKKLEIAANGARMFAHIEGKREIDIGGKDTVRPTLILINSMDGSTRFGFKVGAFRLVCSNGMIAGMAMMNILIRHTSGVDFEAILNSGHKALENLEKVSIPRWRRMKDTPVKPEYAIKLLQNKKLGIPDRLNNRILELTKETDMITLWALYNHYTYHLTHEYRGSEERRLFISSAVERVLGNL